ncbi:MAG: class I SAM-dependent methyltransferase [Gammaproteobacteria bacterium]|nr:class I SAM-dependent methyltransferase [Gammaproteobacteria bacterium]MDH3768161.1 class I SAM-dependent methyltransferase [Gammaproteobacteria bacterium]
MKVRESGMPPPDTWDAYFEPDSILSKLGLTSACHDVVEFGCGYGTFTIPAARRVTGTVFTLDIDEVMIATTRRCAERFDLRNINFKLGDFVTGGTGRPSGSVDYAMLFNIIHHEQPLNLLREAYRNLKAGGSVGIVHWIYDATTPRGPPMDVRPRPEQSLQWAIEAGFTPKSDIIALPPYHYGLVLSRIKK